jgi:hypothetical protein
MPKTKRIDVRSIAAHARKQMLQAQAEVASSGYRVHESSLNAVKKVRVSRNDPVVKSILDIIK